MRRTSLFVVTSSESCTGMELIKAAAEGSSRVDTSGFFFDSTGPQVRAHALGSLADMVKSGEIELGVNTVIRLVEEEVGA